MRRILVLIAVVIAVVSAVVSAVVVASGHPTSAATTDGLFDGGGPVVARSAVNLTVAGRGGVPLGQAGSVALNVTVTNPTDGGFITVWPAGAPRPLASNLNFVAGQTVPNMVVVPLGTGGQISLYSSAGIADVVVDVLGWFPTSGSFHGLTPSRLLDTRPGSPTVDGASSGVGPLLAGRTAELTVRGRGGVPATGVGSVALNVTVTNPTAPGFVTVWPSGEPRPTASNLNFAARQTVPNMVIVPLGADGRISMYLFAGSADVVVDVLGWFPSGPSFNGSAPTRLMDTRPGSPTVDGSFAGHGAIAASATRSLVIAGRGGVPAAGVGSVALNVTVTDPTEPGFVTVWPAASARPTASNLNFVAGQTVANMVVVPLGAAGQVSFFSLAGSADVVVDVLGWFPSEGSFVGLDPARLMDTRRAAPPTGPGATDPRVVAVGDIACDPANGSFNGGAGSGSSCHQRATSDLAVNQGYSAFMALGDLQYDDGTFDAFTKSFDPSWGRVKDITHPVVGNHEYQTRDAAGYFQYFGGSAGDPAKGYYSYDIGQWHVVALNSNCEVVSCAQGSAQETWLRADLAAHPSVCSLVYWHHPRFSSGEHGNNPAVGALYQAAYEYGVDVALAGHDHHYERFAPQNPAGTADGVGIREFVVGTGGKSHYPSTRPQPNSEVRDVDTFGVLELTLHAGSYDWRFRPEAGKVFADTGTTACH